MAAAAAAAGAGGCGEPTLPAFVESTRELLQLEHSTEQEEVKALLEGLSHRERERRGVSICRLQVRYRTHLPMQQTRCNRVLPRRHGL
jgi:hypothetical protein